MLRRLAGIVPVVLLLGCSSSGGSSGSTTRSSAAVASSPSSAPAPAATLAASDRKQIASAFVTFFGGSTSAAQAQRFLQHGATFAAALAQQAAAPQAKSLTARVTAVTAKRPDVALVSFTLLSHGSALLPDTQGYAVQEGGVWKVAAATFCQLLTLQGPAPTQCGDKSITALPGN